MCCSQNKLLFQFFADKLQTKEVTKISWKGNFLQKLDTGDRLFTLFCWSRSLLYCGCLGSSFVWRLCCSHGEKSLSKEGQFWLEAILCQCGLTLAHCGDCQHLKKETLWGARNKSEWLIWVLPPVIDRCVYGQPIVIKRQRRRCPAGCRDSQCPVPGGPFLSAMESEWWIGAHAASGPSAPDCNWSPYCNTRTLYLMTSKL